MTEWVLGLDIGLRKTGVAVGQSLTGTAKPLAILQKPAHSLQTGDIRPWIEEWRVQAVVVGRPGLADGKIHPLDSAINRMIRLISDTWRLPVHEINEYLTSHEAKARRPGKCAADDLAACILIEDFFAQSAKSQTRKQGNDKI